MNLGERLLEYRKEKKLSQEEAAEKIGVSRQTISKWETNQSVPDFDKIIPICELYGITTNELITGDKESKHNEETNDSTDVQNDIEYERKRNKKKALVISISVFLYIIGTFALPYMVEGLNYSDTHALMISATLWAIATFMLIYFFTAYPSKEKDKKDDIEDEILNEINEELGTDVTEKGAKIKVIRENKRIENRIIELIALLFTVVYLIVSFVTMAWHITWILWIVFAFVEAIVKLVFDLKQIKNQKEN